MTSASAAVCLGVDIPHFVGRTQADVEAQLTTWKDGPLKKAWRAAAGRFHPDKNPGDVEAEARFKEAQEAYTFLLGLRVRLRPPAKAQAAFGMCPQGHPRLPVTANFCYECGYAYSVDPLVETLRRAGILERNIETLRDNGELDTLRTLGPANLKSQVQLLQQRQRLGLFGQHAGWKS